MRAQAPEIQPAGRSAQCGDASRADVLEAMQCFRTPGQSLAETGIREEESSGHASGRQEPFRVGEAEPQRAGPDLLLIFKQATGGVTYAGTGSHQPVGMSRTEARLRLRSRHFDGRGRKVTAAAFAFLLLRQSRTSAGRGYRH